MSPRNLTMQSLYLEPEKAELLDALSSETRIPKAVLLREAVDDLLTKNRNSFDAWNAAEKLKKQRSKAKPDKTK